MDLLAEILGLALFVLIVGCKFLPNLIRICTMLSGIVLYAVLQGFYARWQITGETFGMLWSDARFGLIVLAGLFIGVLMRFAMLPFLSDGNPTDGQRRVAGLPSPGAHILVWIVGSIFFWGLFLRPSIASIAAMRFTRMDLPILLYCSVALFVLVVWKLKEEYGKRDSVLSPVHGKNENEGQRSGVVEQQIKRRIEKLQQEAAAAERRWAATVLQERAAKIHAERLAQEFADIRKQQEFVLDPARPLTVSEAFAVLGLSPGCSSENAKDAYHRLILQHHPDKVASLGPQLRKIAEQETKRINAAYSLVTRHGVVTSTTHQTNRTPSRARAYYPQASGPNDFPGGSRETLMARPDAATR